MRETLAEESPNKNSLLISFSLDFPVCSDGFGAVCHDLGITFLAAIQTHQIILSRLLVAYVGPELKPCYGNGPLALVGNV
jgi:hypothetical protein